MSTTISAAWRGPIDLWLIELSAQALSKDTRYTRRQHLEHAARRLGDDPWAITGPDLVLYVATQDWMPETIRAHRTSLRGFYQWATREGHVDESPGAGAAAREALGAQPSAGAGLGVSPRPGRGRPSRGPADAAGRRARPTPWRVRAGPPAPRHGRGPDGLVAGRPREGRQGAHGPAARRRRAAPAEPAAWLRVPRGRGRAPLGALGRPRPPRSASNPRCIRRPPARGNGGYLRSRGGTSGALCRRRAGRGWWGR